MNVRLSTILDAQQALEVFAHKDLSIKTSYQLAKLIKAVNGELELYNEQRIKLLKSLGSTLSEDGTRYTVPAEKQREFENKINELVSVEVSVPDKIKINDDSISISAELLLALEPFIDWE